MDSVNRHPCKLGPQYFLCFENLGNIGIPFHYECLELGVSQASGVFDHAVTMTTALYQSQV